MDSTKLIEEPKLDKPGAGLPLIELAIAKYVVFPWTYNTTTPQQAIDLFSVETQKLLTLATNLKHETLMERRLVPRLTGLEDSSRFWSVAMTIQHLVIVGTGMKEIIVELSKSGTTSRSPRGTADVKPDPAVDAEKVISTFRQVTEQFLQETKPLNVNSFPSATFPHPWFGPLNARGWLTLSGMHQRIHRKQIEQIISRL